MSDHELCHSISKLIGDEEDTLKSFMAFDITPREPVFRVVVGSQIVVSPTKSMSERKNNNRKTIMKDNIRCLDRLKTERQLCKIRGIPLG